MSTLVAEASCKPRTRGSESSDEGLVAATRAGDSDAYALLYERYSRLLVGYVRRIVRDGGRAEEIVQEVFISALRQIRRSDTAIAFNPWIHRIARNAAIDHLRQSRRAQHVSIDDEANGQFERELVALRGPEEHLADRAAMEALVAALGKLRETDQQLVVLRGIEGLSYEEIGGRLGMSAPATKSAFLRARRSLADGYERLTGDVRGLARRAAAALSLPFLKLGQAASQAKLIAPIVLALLAGGAIVADRDGFEAPVAPHSRGGEAGPAAPGGLPVSGSIGRRPAETPGQPDRGSRTARRPSPFAIPPLDRQATSGRGPGRPLPMPGESAPREARPPQAAGQGLGGGAGALAPDSPSAEADAQPQALETSPDSDPPQGSISPGDAEAAPASGSEHAGGAPQSGDPGLQGAQGGG